MKHHPSLLLSSHRPRPLCRRISAIALPVLALIEPATSQAQISTWINTAGGGLEVGANWASGTLPANAAGDVWDFSTLDITAATTVSLNGARTAGSLIFDDLTSSHGWVLNAGTGGPLTLSTVTGVPTVQVNNQSATISVPIAGTQGFEKTGAGTLILSGTNTYTGTTRVSGGILQFGAVTGSGTYNFGLGSGVTVASGATLDFAATHAFTAQTMNWTAPAVTLEDGATLRFRGTTGTNIHNVGADLNANGNVTINNNGVAYGQDINLTGKIGGSGTINYLATSASGSATTTRTLTLNNSASTFSGNWFVDYTASTADDFAALRSTAVGALGTGMVILDDRAQLINGTVGGIDSLTGVMLNQTTASLEAGAGWISSPASLILNAGTANVGTATTTGIIAIGTVIQSAGMLAIDVFTGGSDRVVLGGDYNFSGGGIGITLRSVPTGSYDLVNYGGNLIGTPAVSILNTTRFTPAVNYGAGSNDKISVSFTGAAASLVWTGAISNTWDLATTANFSNAGVADTFYQLDSVLFDDTAETNLSPTITGTMSPTSVTFNNDTKTYTLGGSLSALTTLTKNGTGIAILTGANSHLGQNTINAGVLQVGTGSNTGTLGTGPVQVNAAGTLTFFRNDTGAFAIPNAISGTGALSFLGTGTSNQSIYSLTGNNSGFAGSISVLNGRVQADNSGGSRFGTGVGTALPTGQFYLTGGSFPNTFQISGTGWTETAGQLGALRFGGGSTTTGSITLVGDARINAHGATGNIAGGIAEASGPWSVEFGGSSSAGTLNVIATPATYTGTTSINNATVNIGTTAVPATSNLLATTSAFNVGGATGAGTLRFNLGGNIAFTQPVTFTNAASRFEVTSTSAANALTIGTTLGIDPSIGVMSVTSGGLTLSSSASVNVAEVQITSTPANSATALIGTLSIEPGAVLNTRYMNLGNGSNLSAKVNQTGGTVTIVPGGTGFRLGHWANGATPFAVYNLSGGTLDASGASVHIGWDGGGIMNVSGAGTLKAQRLYVDANGADVPGIVNLLAGGTIEVGSLGTSNDGTVGSILNLGGGTLRGVASSTWASRMDATASTSSTIDVSVGDVLLSGVLSGTGDVTKTGTGNLLITGANTYSGLFTIASGALSIGNGAATGVLNANIINHGTLTFNRSDAVIFDKLINGSGTLMKTGTGSLTLTGLTLLDGPVFVNSGTFAVGSTMTASSVIVGDGATLRSSGTIVAPSGVMMGTSTGATIAADGTAPGTLSVQGDVSLTGTTQIALTPGAYMTPGTPSPLLTFTGSLFGSTTFNVANASSYRQANVIVDAHSVKVDLGTKSLKWTGATSDWDAIGAFNFSDGAPQQFYSGDVVTFDDTAASRAVALVGAMQPARMMVDTTLGYTMTSGTGSIAGDTSMLKTGSGTLVLGTANTFTGGIKVSSGTLELGASATAGGTGLITLGDENTGASPVAVLNSGTALIYANPITVSANGTGTATIGSSVLGSGNGSTFSGLITLNRPTTLQAKQGDKTLFAGQITGPVGTLTIAGGKRVTLRSTANDFAGNIAIVDSGTILQSSEAGAGETIPNGSSIDVAAGAIFRTAGQANSVETINGLTGSGTVTRIVAGLQTLVVGSAGGGGTFSGPITDGSGVFALKKIGAGTQILAGASTYTGATSVEGGVLAITGSLTGTVTTVAGGALEGTGTVGAVTLSSGTLSAGSSSVGILNTGNLALNGGSLLFELAADSTSDRLNTTGTITFAGNVQLSLGFAADLSEGTSFTLIANDLSEAFGVTSGGFFAGATPIMPGVDFTYTSGGFTEIFRPTYTGGDGNDFALTVVPEPGSAVLLLGGLASMAVSRRRRAGRVG